MNDVYKIRKLNAEDETQLNTLIHEVENGLKEEKFWLPIGEVSKIHFFDDEWTYFLGAFVEEQLIGAVALFFNENEYGESIRVLGINPEDVAECGRAMVKPDYQGKGIMKKLSELLIDYARQRGIKKIIATVHPNNIASQTVVASLGFKKKAFVTKMHQYDRDILVLEVQK